MPQDALETVKLRNNFYRDSYRSLVVALLLSLLVIAGLVTTVSYLIMSKPSPKYFAATNSGRMIPLIPLDQPNLSDANVLQWTSMAVVSIYSYNYVNFRQAFQNNRRFFTASGWRGFFKALEDSKTMKAVEDNKLMVSAVLAGAPVINSEYLYKGRYTWEIQMPVLVTYQGSETSNQNFIITLKVERVSTLNNIYGIGISEFVVRRNRQA